MNRLFLGLTAVAGALLVALLGYFNSQELWNWRKFGASIIRIVIAAIVFSLSYPLSEPTAAKDLLTAFTTVTTFDVVTNRVGSSFGWPQFPIRSKSNG